MFCEKCGKEIFEGNKFCTFCGAGVNTESSVVTTPVAQNKEQEGIFKKIPKWVWAICGAGVILFFVILVSVITYRPTVDLNKYVSVEFEGYDTLGKAVVSFDYEEFMDDYEDVIEYANEDVDDDDLDPEEHILKYIDGNLNKTSSLQNGEEVVFEWKCKDERVLKKFNCKLKYENITYVVEDLEEVEVFDPFEDISVSFSGISPNVTVVVENNLPSDLADDMYFTYDKESGLKNGDVVKVTINVRRQDDLYAYFAEGFGKVPTSLEKEYTVEGMPEYVSSLAQVNESSLATLKSEAEDKYKAYAAKDWDDAVTLTSMQNIGYYLLTSKEHVSESKTGNVMVMVYKVNAHVSMSERYNNTQADVSYYTAVLFEDISIDGNGVITFDLNDCEYTNDKYYAEVRYGSGTYSYNTYTFKGYETTAELFEQLITAESDDYSYEGSVTE